MALLVQLLTNRSAQQIVYAGLAGQLRLSIDTVRRWLGILCDLHLGFLVRPWYKNVSRSLRPYQEHIGAPFAFQVAVDADADCFAQPGRPLIVPARTLLSQLL